MYILLLLGKIWLCRILRTFWNNSGVCRLISGINLFSVLKEKVVVCSLTHQQHFKTNRSHFNYFFYDILGKYSLKITWIFTTWFMNIHCEYSLIGSWIFTINIHKYSCRTFIAAATNLTVTNGPWYRLTIEL
jgi:hypothetical protein